MQVYHGDGAARVYLARGIEAGELPVFRSFVGRGLVQLKEFCRGDYAEAEHRGNLRHVTEFFVDRVFESDELANEFMFRHAMELQGAGGAARQGTFVFVSEAGGRQALFYLKNAALEEVSFGAEDVIGESARVTYRIVGGRLDLTP